MSAQSEPTLQVAVEDLEQRLGKALRESNASARDPVVRVIGPRAVYVAVRIHQDQHILHSMMSWLCTQATLSARQTQFLQDSLHEAWIFSLRHPPVAPVARLEVVARWWTHRVVVDVMDVAAVSLPCWEFWLPANFSKKNRHSE